MLATDNSYRVSVAPMMDVTDRHFRYLARQLAPDVRLYTEMIAARAILHGDRSRLLAFDGVEHPVAVQLGGSEPGVLAEAARIATDYGYDEINLNLGCPSGRVRDGGFGACLMKQPDLVARCIEAMAGSVAVPVTVKMRLGVDDDDGYVFAAGFARRVADAGCRTIIVHARKALLDGLSPGENRTVPPLRYDDVYRLKAELSHLRVVINGGIRTLDAIERHLARVDGVMLGRKAAEDPYFLAGAQRRFMDARCDAALPARDAIVLRMYDYAMREAARGTKLHRVTRHMLGLYHGMPGSRGWRRFLSEHVGRPGATPDLLIESLAGLAAGAGA